MENTVLRNTYIKNILSALAVSFFGFVLWNVAFIVFAFIANTLRRFFPADLYRTFSPTPLMLIFFVALLVVVSAFILRSSLSDLVKATWLTVPLVVLLVSVGVLAYSNIWLSYVLGSAIVLLVIVYLWRAKRPWIYYYAVLFTAITLLVFTLTGGEI